MLLEFEVTDLLKYAKAESLLLHDTEPHATA